MHRIWELESERDSYKSKCELETKKLSDTCAMQRDEIDLYKSKCAELEKVIEGALRIRDLWLPSKDSFEHEAEAQALFHMKGSFEDALDGLKRGQAEQIMEEKI